MELKRSITLTVFAGLLSLSALTAPAIATENNTSPQQKMITQKLQSKFGTANVARIQPSPVAGFYEALVNDRLFYVSDDGQYVMTGSLFDLEKMENITQKTLARIEAERLMKQSGQKNEGMLDEIMQGAPAVNARTSSQSSTSTGSSFGQTLQPTPVVAKQPTVNHNQPQVDNDVSPEVEKLIDPNYPSNFREPTTEEKEKIRELTVRESAKELVNSIDDRFTTVFPAKGEEKGVITVFSDPTCPYCDKLHKKMDDIRERGYKVRYLSFPRKGISSPITDQMAVAFCADDRAEAMNYLFEDKRYDTSDVPENCRKMVEHHRKLGETIRVTGTPYLISSEGYIDEGFSSVSSMMKQLNLN